MKNIHFIVALKSVKNNRHYWVMLIKRFIPYLNKQDLLKNEQRIVDKKITVDRFSIKNEIEGFKKNH